MPGVPAVLRDQVAEEPAQAGMATIWPADVDELVEPTAGQGSVEPRSGPLDSAVQSAPGGAVSLALGQT